MCRYVCRLAIECSENLDMVVHQEDVPRLVNRSKAIDCERAVSTICGLMVDGIGYAENFFPRSWLGLPLTQPRFAGQPSFNQSRATSIEKFRCVQIYC